MGRHKIRREAFAKGGVQIGVNGTAASKLQYGLVSACVPAISASGDNSAGSMNITNVQAGDYVFIQPSAGDTGGVYCYAASVVADGQVSASFASTTGSAVAAYTGTFQYMVIG